MVDPTPHNQDPRNQDPQDDEPGLENSGAPSSAELGTPVAPAAAETTAPEMAPKTGAPASAPRSKRGLLIAGGIVATVIVLGGAFGGGVLVGTSVGSNHAFSDARGGPDRAGIPGGPENKGGQGIQRGPGQRGGTDSGPRTDGGPRGGTDQGQGATNG